MTDVTVGNLVVALIAVLTTHTTKDQDRRWAVIDMDSPEGIKELAEDILWILSDDPVREK